MRIQLADVVFEVEGFASILLEAQRSAMHVAPRAGGFYHVIGETVANQRVPFAVPHRGEISRFDLQLVRYGRRGG